MGSVISSPCQQSRPKKSLVPLKDNYSELNELKGPFPVTVQSEVRSRGSWVYRKPTAAEPLGIVARGASCQWEPKQLMKSEATCIILNFWEAVFIPLFISVSWVNRNIFSPKIKLREREQRGGGSGGTWD